MRVLICVLPLLAACASHAPRCDAHLQPINLPGATVAVTEAAR